VNLNNLKKIWNFIEKFGVVLAVIFLVFLGFANRNAIDRYDESSKNSSSNNSIDNKALQSLDRHLTRFWQDSNFEQLTSDFKKANLQFNSNPLSFECKDFTSYSNRYVNVIQQLLPQIDSKNYKVRYFYEEMSAALTRLNTVICVNNSSWIDKTGLPPSGILQLFLNLRIADTALQLQRETDLAKENFQSNESKYLVFKLKASLRDDISRLESNRNTNTNNTQVNKMPPLQTTKLTECSGYDDSVGGRRTVCTTY
jgi:hypothetical protein